MKNRLIYLDNIKVLLIAYVVTGHIAASYGAIGGGRWSYLEPVRDFATRSVLSLYVLPAYSFLMGMFIFISGYFTYSSLIKKGTLKFIRERSVRLGIPLVLYYFVLGPVARYFTRLAKGDDLTFLQFITDSYHSGVYGHLGVMWFIVLILFFSVVYAGYNKLFPNGWFKADNASFPGFLSILLFVVVSSLASYLLRMVFPMGGDFTASRPLGSMVFFAVSFFTGTTAGRNQWLDKLTRENSMVWIILGIVVMILPAIAMVIFRKELNIRMVSQPGTLISLGYSFWEISKTLGTGMLAVLVFRKWFNRHTPLASALGGSVMLAYFLHPLVCALLFNIFAQTAFHPLVKFAIVAPAGLIFTFGIAVWLRKIPFVRKIM